MIRSLREYSILSPKEMDEITKLDFFRIKFIFSDILREIYLGALNLKKEEKICQ